MKIIQNNKPKKYVGRPGDTKPGSPKPTAKVVKKGGKTSENPFAKFVSKPKAKPTAKSAADKFAPKVKPVIKAEAKPKPLAKGPKAEAQDRNPNAKINREGKKKVAQKEEKRVWDPNFKPYFNKGVMMKYEDRPQAEVFVQYFVVNKPYNMLCQFTKEKIDDVTLADLGYDFPPDVYPIGRLDKDSEGMLLISNDKALNINLLDPENKHKRTYWVQVEGVPVPEALKQLRKGVEISIDGKAYQTLPAEVLPLPIAPDVPERNPPVRFRANIPTSWVVISLVEGKNRQVRRMFAKIGYPVLRLIRMSIEFLEIENLRSDKVIEMDKAEVYKLLRIK